MIETNSGTTAPFRRDFIAAPPAQPCELFTGSRLPLPHHRRFTPALSLVERPLFHDSLHARPATLRDLSILAVDDDPTTLELIEMLFEAYGARVTGAVSAEDALASLSRMPEDAPYGLLLSDIGLPGMKGGRSTGPRTRRVLAPPPPNCARRHSQPAPRPNHHRPSDCHPPPRSKRRACSE